MLPTALPKAPLGMGPSRTGAPLPEPSWGASSAPGRRGWTDSVCITVGLLYTIDVGGGEGRKAGSGASAGWAGVGVVLALCGWEGEPSNEAPGGRALPLQGGWLGELIRTAPVLCWDCLGM